MAKYPRRTFITEVFDIEDDYYEEHRTNEAVVQI